MAQGDYITRDNIGGSTDWDKSNDYSNPNKTYWISAPVITVQLYTNASFLASNKGKITVYKWNGTGSGFTQIASGTTHGGYGASDNIWRFVHNCNESYNAYDDGNIHLFKFVVSTSGGGTKTFSVRAGNVRSAHNKNQNTYAPGSLLRCCRPDHWASGNTYSSDEAFVNGENPNAFIGTKITAANSNYVYGEY